MLAGILEHGRPVAGAGGVLELGFAPEERFFLDTAREPENLAFLRAAARELFGDAAEVRLSVLAAGEAGEAPEPPRDTDLTKRRRHEALDHEAVRWAMELFEARVTDVRVEP